MKRPVKGRAPTPVEAKLIRTLGLGWTIAIFVTAVSLRLLISAKLETMPLYRSPQLDSLEYLLRARRIASGDFRWPNPPAHGPGYSFFLAGLLALFGGSLPPVWAVQAGMGAALACAVGTLGARLFGRGSGIAAGFLEAIYAPLLLVETSIFAEGLLLFLLVLAALAAGFGRRPLRAAALAGLLVGAAADVRPTALLFAPALLIWSLFRKEGRGRVRTAVLFVAAMIVPLVPVAVANRRATGSFILVQAHGGMNFYLGNSPVGTGLPTARPGKDWDELEGEALRHGYERAADQDRYYMHKTLQEISRNPGGYLSLLARKLLWLFQAEEVHDVPKFYFFEAGAPLLAWLPGFGVLLPLALAGIVVAARQRPGPWPLFVGLAGLAASCVFLVIGMRYRLPVVPFLMPFAGLALATAASELPKRRWRALVAPGAVALAGLGVSHIWRHEPSHSFAEEWTYTGHALREEGDGAAAKAAFERALSEDANWGPALDGLGLVELEGGDWQDAERSFREALERGGESQKPRYHLGLVLEHAGRQREAIEQFRRALSLRPDDAQTLEALAGALLAQGNAAEAEGLYRKILARVAEHPGAHRGLARIAWGRRDLVAGIAQATQATRFAPDDPEGWLLLAMLRIEAKDAAGAEPAVRRAAELEPHAPPVALARAMLERLRGRPEAADEALRPVIAAAPGYLPAIRLFLQNAAELGRLPEAERYVESVQRGASSGR